MKPDWGELEVLTRIESPYNKTPQITDQKYFTALPERATQNSLAEPLQGSSLDRILTWGGAHPHSCILLPQADLHEPVRRNRSDVAVDPIQFNFEI